MVGLDRDRETGCMAGSGCISFNCARGGRGGDGERTRRKPVRTGIAILIPAASWGPSSLKSRNAENAENCKENAEGAARSAISRKRPGEKRGNCSLGWSSAHLSRTPYAGAVPPKDPRSRSRLTGFLCVLSFFSAFSALRSQEEPRPRDAARIGIAMPVRTGFLRVLSPFPPRSPRAQLRPSAMPSACAVTAQRDEPRTRDPSP